jgi:osmoprotectant transport system substrate-binding protein
MLRRRKTLLRKVALLVVLLFAAGSMLTACSKDEKVINVTSQTWTESVIIGYITQILLEENTDYKINNIVLESNVLTWQAFKNNEVDIWGGYTSSFFNLFEDDETVLYDPDAIYEYVSKKLRDEHNIILLERMGFYCNYDLAVLPEIAEKYNLETYSDLAKVSSELRIAADANFLDRPDCYPLYQEQYNMDFADIFLMAVSAKFEALNNRNAEVISCYTTDAGISRYGLVLLKDDKQVNYHFDAVYVVRKEILDTFPELESLLNQVKISNEEMSYLNYLAEVENMDAKDVARQYLEVRGLI